MKYCDFQIVLQEVPGEISLSFTITGCPLKCEGCHSPYLWKNSGTLLTENRLIELLEQYRGLATCVLFMGGEWHQNELIHYLKLSRAHNYKTCLYTGEEQVSNELLKQLTWIKTGKWDTSRGGLNNDRTNQKFIEVRTNKNLNHLFITNQL